ncbi:MAG: DUF262 domain-containing protein [Cetobacterium sp.]|uniref:DUF262 domain-containing protein n=1 Tax=Cetobacterium sp. TaxID=2071632 RepID=UPI003F377DF6
MLLEGEKIKLENKDDKNKVILINEELDEKYMKNSVKIVTEQARYSLKSIPEMLKTGDYILRPEFQRRHRWNIEKKSKLIESFIINIPIPPIFLYEIEYSTYEVMDGLQRLTAIDEFYKDKYELKGLEIWPELNGRKYSELPEQLKKGIDRRYLSSVVLLNETAKSVEEANVQKQFVFERINSGGVELSHQESRNAIYNGNMNYLCIELSENKYLRKTWKIEIDNEGVSENEIFKSMGDVELVLRYFAFRQIENIEFSTIKEILDFYLKESNKFHETILLELKVIFEKTIKLIYNLFGDEAFWVYRKREKKGNKEVEWFWYPRANKMIYDVFMQIFSENLNNEKELILKKDLIKNKLEEFFKKNYKTFGGRDNNKKDIEKRRDLFRKFLNEEILKGAITNV